MIRRKIRSLNQRILMSTIAAAILFLVVSYSFTPNLAIFLPLTTAIVISAALKEYYEIAKTKGLQPGTKLGIGLTFIYIFAIFLNTQSSLLDSLPLITLGITLITIFCHYFTFGENPLVNMAVTLFAILYLVIPLSYTVQINYFFPIDHPQDGRWWLFFLIAITYATDSSALFIGKTFGKKQLAPYISPNKTWAGAVGGFFIAIAVSLIFYYFANIENDPIPIKLSFRNSLFLGSTISILAQFGDLAESLLKRDVGIKDSSTIPGLGGILDIIDSLIFTTPLLYIYLKSNTGV